jgi:hypothetical protein
MATPKEQFEAISAKEGFSVCFSKKVARLVEYRDPELEMEFSVDGSDRGEKWLALEHWPFSMPRNIRYDIAYSRTKSYLESCGYNVEVWPPEGGLPNQVPDPTFSSGTSPAVQEPRHR